MGWCSMRSEAWFRVMKNEAFQKDVSTGKPQTHHVPNQQKVSMKTALILEMRGFRVTFQILVVDLLPSKNVRGFQFGVDTNTAFNSGLVQV